MRLSHRVWQAVAALGIGVTAAGAASAQSIQLTEIQILGLNGLGVVGTTASTNVGTYASAIAWDGTNLFVGGYNQSGAAANVGVVEVANALSANPTVGTPFAPIVNLGNDLGYTELALPTAAEVAQTPGLNGEIAASLDAGGGSGISVAAYNASSGAILWSNGSGNGNSAASTSIRGNGVGFDPGYVTAGTTPNGTTPSAGTVATLTINSGRRIAFNGTTGAYVYSQTGGPSPNGAVIYPGSGLIGTSTVWRSLAFNPATGDEYARDENGIVKMQRTGDNTYSPSTLIASAAGSGNPFSIATNINNENIAFVNSSVAGNFLIANDHASNAGGQVYTSVLRAVDTSGNLLPVNVVVPNGSGFFLPQAGSGSYNFSYDAVTNTLAMSDFSRSQVFIYSVGLTATPEPGAVALLMSGGIALTAIRRRRFRRA